MAEEKWLTDRYFLRWDAPSKAVQFQHVRGSPLFRDIHVLTEEVLNGNGSPTITESRRILSLARTARHGEYRCISGSSGREERELVDCAWMVL